MELQKSEIQEYNNVSNNEELDSWYILSILSWIIFICTIWRFHISNIFIEDSYLFLIEIFLSIQSKTEFLSYFIFLISFLGFSAYLIFTTCKRKQSLYDGMMGNWSKFHFIPLLFISSMYLISFNVESGKNEDNLRNTKALLILDIIFTLIALISLIIIYLNTELNCEWYLVITIKKGVFSTFIILLWYHFFCDIIYLKSVDYFLEDLTSQDKESLYKFYKGMYISISLIIEIGSLLFSFFCKDLVAAFVNFLIYLGFVINFFRYNAYEFIKEDRKEYFGGNTVGIIVTIMMCLNLIYIAFLVLKFSQRLF